MGGEGEGHKSTRDFSFGGGPGHDSAGRARLTQDTRCVRRSDEGLCGGFNEQTEVRLRRTPTAVVRVYERDGGNSFVVSCVPQQLRGAPGSSACSRRRRRRLGLLYHRSQKEHLAVC